VLVVKGVVLESILFSCFFLGPFFDSQIDAFFDHFSEPFSSVQRASRNDEQTLFSFQITMKTQGRRKRKPWKSRPKTFQKAAWKTTPKNIKN